MNMEQNLNWKKQLHEEYRVKFGCKNIGQICWCRTCMHIETLIRDTVKKVKENIPD